MSKLREANRLSASTKLPTSFHENDLHHTQGLNAFRHLMDNSFFERNFARIVSQKPDFAYVGSGIDSLASHLAKKSAFWRKIMIWANEDESATYTVVKQLCERVCCSVAKHFRADNDEVWTHVTNVVVPRVCRHEKIDCLERYVRRSAKKEAIKFCISNLSLASSIKSIDEKVDHRNELNEVIDADAAEFLIRRSASLLRPELLRALLIFLKLRMVS